MTDDRPAVKRTYGKAAPTRPAASSSSSMIFESSSPPSSPRLITPHPSSDFHIDVVDPDLVLSVPGSSSTQDKENAPPRQTQSTLSGYFTLPNKKRPFEPPAPSVARQSKPTDKGLTQLHLAHLPLLHTCQQCQMSYVRGGEDEGLHERHHARVTRGIIWDGLGRARIKSKGKDKSREETSEKVTGWRTVKENVSFGTKGKGRIIVAEGSFGGPKLDDILQTVDTVLSSPPLPPAILERCRIFLFVTASPAPSKRLRPGFHAERIPKERVVAVVVAQGIKWAMRVLRANETAVSLPHAHAVESGEGVLCDPTRLDTPLGIHRLFTIPSYRSLGLAQMLLDAACEHTVYGCHFGPDKGQVAFSQPTSSGKAVMEKWGGGQVRVFVDDESQL